MFHIKNGLLNSIELLNKKDKSEFLYYVNNKTVIISCQFRIDGIMLCIGRADISQLSLVIINLSHFLL